MPLGVAARVDLELPADAGSVTEARAAVRRFATDHGVEPDVVLDVALAVTEAVTNAVLHAFVDRPPGTVRVAAVTGPDEITVIVTDDGCGMRPRPDSPGLGLGLPTIGRLAALLDLRVPEGGGTEVSMTFVAPGVRGPEREPELLESVGRTAQGAWPGEGVQRLVDLLVPAVADACAVDVVDPTGYPERFAGRINGSEADTAWLTGLRPRADVPRSATRAALETGDAHVSELTLDLIGRITTNVQDAARMAATGIRWWVAVPLRDGERVLGLLHFGLLPGRGRPTRERVEFLASIADRAASALAHHQLLTELQRTRRLFERVLDLLGEAVVVRDESGRIAYANAAAHALGIDLESATGRETTLVEDGERLTVTIIARLIAQPGSEGFPDGT